MKKSLYLAIAVAAILPLLFSCSLKKRYSSETARTTIEINANRQRIQNALYLQYQEWKGTPHQKGGLSRRGIDCSGFVYLTFLSQFDTKLPRTTEKLAQLGVLVKKDILTAGDLLFFRTGIWEQHVGIYVENNNFLHASTSRGVILSSLTESYWKNSYHRARRIPID